MPDHYASPTPVAVPHPAPNPLLPNVPPGPPMPLPNNIPPPPQSGPTAEIVRQRIRQAIAEGLSAQEALASIAEEFFGGDSGATNSWVASNMTATAPTQAPTVPPKASLTPSPLSTAIPAQGPTAPMTIPTAGPQSAFGPGMAAQGLDPSGIADPMAGVGPYSLPTNFTDTARSTLSESPGGRGALYNRWLSASPEYNALNPWGRSVLKEQAGPISAGYALSGTTGNFRDWAANPENRDMAQDPGWIRGQLEGIQNQGFAPMPGQTDAGWQGGMAPLTPNPYQGILDDEGLTRDLIDIIARGQVNPALRRGYLGSVGRSVSGWQDQNPEAPIFSEFARRGFRW